MSQWIFVEIDRKNLYQKVWVFTMFFLFLFLIWPLNNYKHKHTVCKINNINTQVNTKQDKQ